MPAKPVLRRLISTALALILGLTSGIGSFSMAASAATPTPKPTPPAVEEASDPVVTEKPGVYLLKGSSINLVSRQSKIPVAVKNTFSTDVRVHVHIAPSNTRVIVPSAVEVLVPAGETITAQVPVEAVASGKVFLIVRLTTFSGRPLTENTIIEMNVEPDVEGALIAGFAASVLVLGLVGGVRMARRAKKAKQS